MIEKYIEAINAGEIISVDWSSIEEMLGENNKRSHDCSIFMDDGFFPPKNKMSSDHFTEEQIDQILKRTNVRFMAETYKDSGRFSIEHRYFSAVKPMSGPWRENPN